MRPADRHPRRPVRPEDPPRESRRRRRHRRHADRRGRRPDHPARSRSSGPAGASAASTRTSSTTCRSATACCIEDGLLRFLCTDKNYNELRCHCTAGGMLKSSKGINLPDTAVNVPSITDRDWECVDWAIDNDLDYLALSFVRKADDLHLLREHLRNKVSDIHLIAKIEKAEALEQIDAIIDASDGLMVARGDLGVEMDVAQVPIIQKDLIRRCQTAGKPVIVATQMLQSMIEQAQPDAGRGQRRRQRDLRRHRRGHAQRRNVGRQVPASARCTSMTHVAEVTEEYLVVDARRGRHEPEADRLDAAVFRGDRPRRLADRAGPEGEAGGDLEPDRRDRADLFQAPLPDADRRPLQRPPGAAADGAALWRAPAGDGAAGRDERTGGGGRRPGPGRKTTPPRATGSSSSPARAWGRPAP